MNKLINNEEVIIKEKDYKKEQRNEFAKNEVMINYPNVSEKIFEHFEQIFNGD